MAYVIKALVFVSFATACGQPIKGEQGPPGPAGATGAEGERGPTGANGITGSVGPTGAGLAVVSRIHCSKIVVQLFEYSAYLFANGSRFVFCEVSGSSIEASVTGFYAPDQAGATTGSCLVTYDVDGTASGGYWNFTLSPLRAIYNDAGSGNDQQSVTFAASDCMTGP